MKILRRILGTIAISATGFIVGAFACLCMTWTADYLGIRVTFALSEVLIFVIPASLLIGGIIAQMQRKIWGLAIACMGIGWYSFYFFVLIRI